MPKYMVTIHEVHSCTVVIEADSPDAAREKAEDERNNNDEFLAIPVEYNYTLEPDQWTVILAP